MSFSEYTEGQTSPIIASDDETQGGDGNTPSSPGWIPSDPNYAPERKCASCDLSIQGPFGVVGGKTYCPPCQLLMADEQRRQRGGSSHGDTANANASMEELMARIAQLELAAREAGQREGRVYPPLGQPVGKAGQQPKGPRVAARGERKEGPRQEGKLPTSRSAAGGGGGKGRDGTTSRTPTQNNPNPPTLVPSDGSSASNVGSKEDSGKKKICVHFLKGECRRKNCKFAHPEVPKTPDVILDVKLDDEELAETEKDFPGIRIKNGTGISAHARLRAERAIVSYQIARSFGHKKVLEIQGRYRKTDGVPARDICRRMVTHEDNEDCCMGLCRHMESLAKGEYESAYALDVPLQPDEIAHILRNLTGRMGQPPSFFLAIHLHQRGISSLHNQFAVWKPTDDHNQFGTTGSVGAFSISVDGRASFEEADHVWMTMQLPVGGVKPETVCKLGTYHYMRFTLTSAPDPTPSKLTSVLPFLGRRASKAYVQQPAGGEVIEVIRVHDDFILIRDDQGWFVTDPVMVHEMQSKLAARPPQPANGAVVRRAVVAAVRSDSYNNSWRLAAVLEHIEISAQCNYQRALDVSRTAETSTGFSLIDDVIGSTRRDTQKRLLLQTKGEATSHSLRVFLYGFTFCGAIMLTSALLDAYGHNVLDVFSPYIGVRNLPQYASMVVNCVVIVAVLKFIGGQSHENAKWWCYAIYFAMFIGYVRGETHDSDTPGHFLSVTVLHQYMYDRFGEVEYAGPLPKGFGLPGYVCPLSYPELGEDCWISVKEPEKYVDTDNPRNTLFAVGVTFAGYLPSVALPCQENMVAAARTRQLAAMPDYDQEFFWQVVEDYWKKLSWQREMEETNYEQWNSRFPGSRQLQHDCAAIDVQDQNFEEFHAVRRNVFIKVEKILKLTGKPYKPRVITGATHLFNVMVAPWMYKLKDVVEETLSNMEDDLVMLASGKTAQQMGEWFAAAQLGNGRAICGDDQLVFADGTCVESDGSKHDAHMHKGFFNFKWETYRKIASEIPDEVLKYAREFARETYAFSKAYSVKWFHPYRVRSGDPDTERGNSLTTDLVASNIQKWTRELHKNHTAFEIEEELKRRALKMGYEITVKVHHDLAHATFLSGAFAPVNGVFYWFPLPGRQLAKMGWTIKNFKHARMMREYAGVLNSYRDYTFVPFLRKYVDIVSQLIPERYRKEAPSRRWLVGPGITPQYPADDTWEWFERRYGLNIQDEAEFEMSLLKVKRIPFMMNSEAVKIMAAVDLE